MSRFRNVLAALCFFCFTLALTGCNSGTAVIESTKQFPAGTGFQTFTVNVDGSDHKYTVFVPKDYSPQKKYPAIVFLHGVLESGSDAVKNVGVGLGPDVSSHAETWGFITVFPHSSGDWQGDTADHICMAALDDTCKRFSVDQDRIILTGLSNGGQGTWLIGAAHKDRFAALIPVSGHTAYDVCPKLTGISIRCYHNGPDMLVSSSGAEKMCEKINAAGGAAKLTMFSGMAPAFNHDIWEKVYGDAELYKWMMAQHRGTVAAIN